jgi:hypothetical protein
VPQRSSRWIDLLVGALIVFILLGGIGKAFSDSDLFAAQPQPAASTGVEACPEGGCTKPPDELCSGRAVRAVVMPGGERVYFAGDHRDYHKIIAIHVERGDRWFCTTAGAEENGFVAAP